MIPLKKAGIQIVMFLLIESITDFDNLSTEKQFSI